MKLQEWFTTMETIRITYNISVSKKKKIYDWINRCSEDIDEIQQPFLTEALHKVGKEEEYLK